MSKLCGLHHPGRPLFTHKHPRVSETAPGAADASASGSAGEQSFSKNNRWSSVYGGRWSQGQRRCGVRWEQLRATLGPMSPGTTQGKDNNLTAEYKAMEKTFGTLHRTLSALAHVQFPIHVRHNLFIRAFIHPPMDTRASTHFHPSIHLSIYPLHSSNPTNLPGGSIYPHLLCAYFYRSRPSFYP